MVADIDNTELVMSAQLQEPFVGNNQRSDPDGEIREGILSAVMHVAAAGVPSTRELALGFVAANEGIVTSAPQISCSFALLRRALAHGLSPDLLKNMALARRSASELLDAMQHGAQLVQHSGDGQAGVAEYRKVIVDAAERAARTQISAAFLTRRPTYAQRVAIAQIRSALTT
jgi:hypothetical protein